MSALAEASTPLARPSTARSLLRELRRTPAGVLLAAALLLVLATAALWPAVLQLQDPFAVEATNNLAPPSSTHPFGTDQSGRDVFSRVVEGTRQSLLVGIGATAAGLALGGLLGISGALAGGWIDRVLSRIIEVLFAFPSLLLALLCIAVAGPGITTVALAVGVGTAPGYARILRVQTQQVLASPYVEASTALGRTPTHLFIHTILPNVARPLLALATLGIGQAVVWAAALSFLGLGAPPPAAEWGTMLSDGRNYVQLAWWIAVFPGLAITGSALAATVVGRHVQRRLEGRA